MTCRRFSSERALQVDRAFTLIELVLVLMVMAVVAAMVAPSLRGWSRGSALRTEGDQFLSLATWARTQSVSQAVRYRIEFDGATYRASIEQDAGYVADESKLGRSKSLPPGYKIEFTPIDDESAMTIDFSPLGRTTPSRVKITSDLGDSISLECSSAGETFHVVM